MPQIESRKSLSETLRSELDGLTRIKDIFVDIDRAVGLLLKRRGGIVVTGVGKSAFIGMKIAATLTSLGNRAIFLHPVDALHGDAGSVHKDDVLIAISYSGESNEVTRIASYIKKEFKVPIISITSDKKSALGKLSNIVLEVLVKREGSALNLAPMASTTATLVVGDLLASLLSEKQGFKEHHFARLHPAGGLSLKMRPAKELATRKSLPLIKEKGPFQRGIAVLNKGGKGIAGILDTAGKLVGVVTDGDIRRFFLKNDSAKDVPINKVMTKSPKTLPEGASAYDALSLMRKYKITALFLVDERKRPQALIHMHDII